MLFVGFTCLLRFGTPPCEGSVGKSHTDFMGTPRCLCSGASPACLGSALGRGVQGDVQVLCGRTGVDEVLRNPQATPFLPSSSLATSYFLLVN